MQRGFSLVLILVVLSILSAVGAGSFYLFNKQQIAAINSFDECAKKYPVMESYPAQCNTPDGRHFVQELSEEEKQKLVPPIESSDSAKKVVSSIEGWHLYENKAYGLSIMFPPWLILCSSNDLFLYEGKDQSDCEAGEGVPFLVITDKFEGMGDIDISNYPDCYSINKKDILLNGINAREYTKTIIKDTGECTMTSAYARNEKHIVLDIKGKTILISDIRSDQTDIKNQILSTLQLTSN